MRRGTVPHPTRPYTGAGPRSHCGGWTQVAGWGRVGPTRGDVGPCSGALLLKNARGSRAALDEPRVSTPPRPEHRRRSSSTARRSPMRRTHTTDRASGAGGRAEGEDTNPTPYRCDGQRRNVDVGGRFTGRPDSRYRYAGQHLDSPATGGTAKRITDLFNDARQPTGRPTANGSRFLAIATAVMTSGRWRRTAISISSRGAVRRSRAGLLA